MRRTLAAELAYRVEKHTLPEVLDRLADLVKHEGHEKLVKALELAVTIALELETE